MRAQLYSPKSIGETSTVELDLEANVVLDSQLLSMASHIAATCRSSFYQMRQLRFIIRSLSAVAMRALVQAFVHCRLDYCNSLLTGAADVHFKRCRSVTDNAQILAYRKSPNKRRVSIKRRVSDKRRVPNKRRVTGGYDGTYGNFWIDCEQTSGCF